MFTGLYVLSSRRHIKKIAVVVVGDYGRLLFRLLSLLFSCVCFSCAEVESKQPKARTDRLVNAILDRGQNDQDWFKSTKTVIMERTQDTHFLQTLLESSRSSKNLNLYEDNMAFYENNSRSIFLLPNATLTICFSVVFGYMIYIILALMCKQQTAEDNTNPALKILFSDVSFRGDVIPAKLRCLYGELEPGSTETLLSSHKTDLASAEFDERKDKTSSDHLFSSAI